MGSSARSREKSSGSIPSGEPEAGVDIAPEIRQMIRDFAQALPQRDYYQVLGLEHDADEREIRRAFFEVSKRFHPDRYFRKCLGPYADLLSEIYKRIVMANEVLGDALLRADYDKQLSARTPRTPAAALPDPGEASASRARKGGPSLRSRPGLCRAPSGLARLRGQLESSREQAGACFREALAWRDQADWDHAVRSLRLALVLDPREPEYAELLAEWLPCAYAEQAERLRGQAHRCLEREEFSEALARLQQAFELAPTDATAALEIAEIAWLRAGDPERALAFALQAAALEPDDPHPHKQIALILEAQGQYTQARREFQRAWELDPMDEEVKQALARVPVAGHEGAGS